MNPGSAIATAKKQISTNTSDKGVAFLSSLFLSITWVRSYGYSYNVRAFYTYGINIWALSLWIVTGYITLHILFFVKRRIRQPFLHLPLTWLVYFAGLLLFEYIGYYILNIREQSAHPGDALIFGVIHGTGMLHIYYVSFPVLISGVHHFVSVTSRSTVQYAAVARNAISGKRYKMGS